LCLCRRHLPTHPLSRRYRGGGEGCVWRFGGPGGRGGAAALLQGQGPTTIAVAMVIPSQPSAATSPTGVVGEPASALLLQENAWPPVGGGGGKAASPEGQRSSGAAREFGTPVGGKSAAGGFLVQPQRQGSSALAWSSQGATAAVPAKSAGPGFEPASLASPQHSLRLDKRRKRPAIYEDDEFRGEQSHAATPPAAGGASSAAPSRVASDGDGGGRGSGGSSGLSAMPAVTEPAPPTGALARDVRRAIDDLDLQVGTAVVGQDRPLSDANALDGSSEHVPFSSASPMEAPVLPSSSGPNAQVAEDEDAESILGSEDKENEPRLTSERAMSALDSARVLREMAIEVPAEDCVFSEVEYSSSEDGDCPGEGPPSNLAELLAERVRQNAEGRYDFDIYEDP